MTAARIVVAALGDSITAGTPRWDPDPEVRRRIGRDLDERHQWPYWAMRADPRLDVRNHGVNRERTDEIAQRLQAATAGADTLVIQAGINDLVQGCTPQSAVAAIREMILRGLDLDLGVTVAEVLPWNNGYPRGERPIRQLNELLHALAEAERVGVVPFYSAVEDPARPGRMRENWTDDGNHPSLAGHRRLGEMAASTLSPYSRRPDPWRRRRCS
jgi:lysophospholipase L1-like esterase